MKKILRFLGVAGFVAAVGAPCTAQADPCGALTCLAGIIEGGSGGPFCYALTADYFAIRSYWHGHLDCPPIMALRAQFLATCPDVLNKPWIPVITSMPWFGCTIVPPPFPIPPVIVPALGS